MVTVVALPTGGWRVELSEGQQPFVFPAKGQALTFALAWADAHQPCEARVYGRLGELDRHLTFPDGNYRLAPKSDRRRTQVEIGFRDRRQQERRAQV